MYTLKWQQYMKQTAVTFTNTCHMLIITMCYVPWKSISWQRQNILIKHTCKHIRIHSVYMCEPLLQYNTCGNSCTVNNLTNLFSSCFCSIHSLSFPPLTVWRSLMNSLCASSLLKLPSDFHRFLMTKQEMNHNKNVVNLYSITILTSSWSGSTSEYIYTRVV